MQKDVFCFQGCIAVINGPNMNFLGIREPDIYGTETLQSINENLHDLVKDSPVELKFFQSNIEGEIVDYIQNYYTDLDGIVINPASYQNTGEGILDALLAVDLPFVEVHMSNIFSREKRHHKSIFASKSVGSIVGFKSYVYELGLRAILKYLIEKRGN